MKVEDKGSKPCATMITAIFPTTKYLGIIAYFPVEVSSLMLKKNAKICLLSSVLLTTRIISSAFCPSTWRDILGTLKTEDRSNKEQIISI